MIYFRRVGKLYQEQSGNPGLAAKPENDKLSAWKKTQTE
jgi:hypothetical protein